MDTADTVIGISGEGFSLRHTFECGQCFRYKKTDKGYINIAMGRALLLEEKEGQVFFNCSGEDFDGIWLPYFDLQRNYADIAAGFPKDPFTQSAISYGWGLKILRQDPWEALCSFIISQCNNIPRIMSIIDKLCNMFGSDIHYMQDIYKSFPSAQTICGLSESDLAPLRAGYRIEYILNAARAVEAGELDFAKLGGMPTEEARRTVMQLKGVGAKVADCFLLFGMGRLDAFPVDTWMKKARSNYNGEFPKELFSQYGGIAQQYIFYYTRAMGKK